MARRRNLKDLLTPEPTPDKQLTHPSGWCMTMSHEFCPYQFNHGKCGCSCHTDPKLVKKERTTVSNDNQPKKRGRPKKEESVESDYVDPRPWKR